MRLRAVCSTADCTHRPLTELHRITGNTAHFNFWIEASCVLKYPFEMICCSFAINHIFLRTVPNRVAKYQIFSQLCIYHVRREMGISDRVETLQFQSGISIQSGQSKRLIMSDYSTPYYIEVISEFTYTILKFKCFLPYTDVFCRRYPSSCQFLRYQFWTICVFETQVFNFVVSAVINWVIRKFHCVTRRFWIPSKYYRHVTYGWRR